MRTAESPPIRRLRSMLAVTASAAALTAALLVPTTPAHAASAVGTVSGTGTDGLRLRAEPNTTSTIKAVLPEGTQFVIDCQTTGTPVTNLSTGRQSDIWNYSNARAGFVPHAYIAASSTSWIPDVPRCGSSSATVTVGNTGGVGIRVRSQPNTNSAILTVVPENTQITVRCQASGQSITNEEGQASSWWDFSEQHQGYVPHAYMIPRLPERISGVPLCDTTEPPPTSGDGTPVPGIPKPCAGNQPYPTGVSTAQAVAQMQTWSGITFAAGDRNFANYPGTVRALWESMQAVRCTDFVQKARQNHTTAFGSSLTIRARTLNFAGGVGHYTKEYNGRRELNLWPDNIESQPPAKRVWTVIHELTHPYNADRLYSNPIYWQQHNQIFNTYGALSNYGGQGGITENVADMTGYFVGRCAIENSAGRNPYSVDNTRTRAYYNLASTMFAGRTFGPAPGGTC